jgi:hypothetical protein
MVRFVLVLRIYSLLRHFIRRWSAGPREDNLTAPKILLDEARGSPPSLLGRPDLGWAMLVGVGFAFLLVGCFEIGRLPWLPLKIGVPYWDFGNVSPSYAALPLVTMGLAFPLASGVALGRQKLVLTTSCVLLSMGTLLLLAPLLYSSGVLVVWYHGGDPLQTFGLKAVVTKGLVRATVYPVLYLWLGLRGLRYALARREAPSG